MTEETHELWNNAPEGFDPRDRNALHTRFPEGFVIVQISQGRTPSTPDNPPEGYRDFNAVTFHGVDLQATTEFSEELEDEESFAELSRVPSGDFEVIYRVRWHGGPLGGRWHFGLWREGGEVVYHALTSASGRAGPPVGYFIDWEPDDNDDPEGSGEWAWGTFCDDTSERSRLGTAETYYDAVSACWREEDGATADEDPHVCAGCIGGGPCDLEIGQRDRDDYASQDAVCDGCSARDGEDCDPDCPVNGSELGGGGEEDGDG